MSQTLPNINLSVSTSPIIIIPPGNLQASQISWIEFQNISPYDCLLSAGSVNVPIPAWDDFFYQVCDSKQNIIAGFSLPITFEFMIIGVLSSNISTTLRVTFYSLGETPTNTQSRQLVRQTWTPNNVSTVGGVATGFANDGQPGGTQVGEATPLGGLMSYFTLDNDGNSYFNGQVEVHGQIVANKISTEPGNDFVTSVQATHSIFDMVNGIDVTQTSATLFSLLNGLKLAWPSLSISDISWFGPYTVTTTATAFAHNMTTGAPQLVIPVLMINSATLHVVFADIASVTPTTINLRSEGTDTAAYGICFRF